VTHFECQAEATERKGLFLSSAPAGAPPCHSDISVPRQGRRVSAAAPRGGSCPWSPAGTLPALLTGPKLPNSSDACHICGRATRRAVRALHRRRLCHQPLRHLPIFQRVGVAGGSCGPPASVSSVPSSVSLRFREHEGRAGVRPGASRGRRCSRRLALRLPLPAPRWPRPGSAFISPPGTAGEGGAGRGPGVGPGRRGGACGTGAGARGRLAGRTSLLHGECWSTSCRSLGRAPPPPASRFLLAAPRRRLHHCIMLPARRQRTPES
jgi:hypothetical protein